MTPSATAPAFIALGSNLDEPALQLRRGVSALAALPDTRLEQVSSVYRSAAVGPGTQPDYLNAVARLATRLAPEALLDALQRIEQAQGRQRGARWGPRTLDLDILLYGHRQIRSPRLTIPHPRMRERDFVLYPLREISNTNLQLPDGMDIDSLIRLLPEQGLVKTHFKLRGRD
jgi:2-amino-4-hydroxy-6-hydroxymethyldihydropteridine diphosphokinase